MLPSLIIFARCKQLIIEQSERISLRRVLQRWYGNIILWLSFKSLFYLLFSRIQNAFRIESNFYIKVRERVNIHWDSSNNVCRLNLFPNNLVRVEKLFVGATLSWHLLSFIAGNWLESWLDYGEYVFRFLDNLTVHRCGIPKIYKSQSDYKRFSFHFLYLLSSVGLKINKITWILLYIFSSFPFFSLIHSNIRCLNQLWDLKLNWHVYGFNLFLHFRFLPSEHR